MAIKIELLKAKGGLFQRTRTGTTPDQPELTRKAGIERKILKVHVPKEKLERIRRCKLCTRGPGSVSRKFR